MTVQEEPDTFKEKALKKDWPFEQGTTFGTTKQTVEQRTPLEPEEESLVNRVGQKGFQ